LLPHPPVHADLAPAAALAAADEHRSTAAVEVRLAERERLMDAQPGSPEHDNERTQATAVCCVAGGSHHGDDVLDGWRVGGIANALVARRSTGVEPGIVAGERRRPAASSSDSVMRFS
jgi:hypothetical protein